MTKAKPLDPSIRPGLAFPQLRVWHLGLLVLFVAVAIADIQDHGRREPVLIALATAGYTLYGLLCLGAWRFARRFGSRLKPTALLAVYMVAMAGVFLVATVLYLGIESVYLIGY